MLIVSCLSLALQAAPTTGPSGTNPVLSDPEKSKIGPPEKDYTVVAEGGSVQLSLRIPGDVKRTRTSLTLEEQKFPGWTWTAAVDGRRYMVTVITVPQEATDTLAKDVARRQAADLATDLKGLAGKVRTTESGVFEAFETDVRGGAWQGQRASARLRAVYAGNFVLTMSVVHQGVPFDAVAGSKFFESLVYASIDRIQPDDENRQP